MSIGPLFEQHPLFMGIGLTLYFIMAMSVSIWVDRKMEGV